MRSRRESGTGLRKFKVAGWVSVAETLLSWAYALVLVGTRRASTWLQGPRISLGLHALAEGPITGLLHAQDTWSGNSGRGEAAP